MKPYTSGIARPYHIHARTTLKEVEERKTFYDYGKHSDFVWSVLNREIKNGNCSRRTFFVLSVCAGKKWKNTFHEKGFHS